MRKVLYISGTRADFGLMRKTLLKLEACPEIDIAIAATGMHLSSRHGETVKEIESSGLRIASRVPVELEPATGATMARSIAAMISGLTDTFEAYKPDIVLVLGDRGEMLASAIAAIHLNIPVAHVHGGERSGTVDESVRHAITKLSHIHFAATEKSRERLIAMGESPANVHVTGAPGLDGVLELANKTRQDLWRQYALAEDQPTALFLFHPVLQEEKEAGNQATGILDALRTSGMQVLALMPNSDAGSDPVREAIQSYDYPGLHSHLHLPREDFLGVLKHCDVLIGNSSAGLIEAASFGTPVLNIGQRQSLRERNRNVTDVAPDKSAIVKALADIKKHGRYPVQNVYGDGKAGERICRLLADDPAGCGTDEQGHDLLMVFLIGTGGHAKVVYEAMIRNGLTPDEISLRDKQSRREQRVFLRTPNPRS